MPRRSKARASASSRTGRRGPRIPRGPDTGTPAGVDVFIASDLMPATLAVRLVELCESLPLGLKMISNRGVQVYPPKGVTPDPVDVYRCRFFCNAAGAVATDDAILELRRRISPGLSWMHIEKLQYFADATDFTKARGES